MAGRRKARRTTPPREDLSRPSKWRLQHGGFDEGVRGTDPETGTPTLHRRAVDSLGVLLAKGSITREMHEAGCIFRALFQRAAFARIRTMSMIRLPSGSGDLLSESQAVARERIGHALLRLGGFTSPAGSIAWHVLGLEQSLRDWALRQGWNGRPVTPTLAHGILLGTLGMLAVHYGLARPSAAGFSDLARQRREGAAAKSAQRE